MRTRQAMIIGVGWLAAVLWGGVGAAAAQDYAGPVALAAGGDGARLYVAEQGNQAISVWQTATGERLANWPLAAAPTGLAYVAERNALVVTTAGPAGQVLLLDADDGQVRRAGVVGHTPMCPVWDVVRGRVYVCCRFEDVVRAVDPDGGQVVRQWPVQREPVAAALGGDGRTLLVANHLPNGPADGDYVAAAVSLVDLEQDVPPRTVPLPNGASGVRGMAVAADGRWAYVTHVLGRYQLPTTQLQRGWMNTNALSIIDVAAGQWYTTVLLDDLTLGAANPWGVAVNADGSHLVVSHAGTHELSLIDRPGLHDRLERIRRGEGTAANAALTWAEVPDDLTLLLGLRRRVALPGNGPRAIAVSGDRVYAAEYFSDTVAVASLAADQVDTLEQWAVAEFAAVSTARRGEMLFNDATMCFQQWQSCASCHPDGRADGLNWDLLNDGMGNPKNTKSLLLAHATPPAMSTGVRDRAETAVRAGIRFIQFTERPEADAAAIDTYLQSLQPVASPYREPARANGAAARGAALYEQAGCGACHSGPVLTNAQAYDVGTGVGAEQGRAFDTPTLVEVWRTRPYLYDGRAADMPAVLRRHNQADLHGVTSTLTPAQVHDLAVYVLTQ